MLTRVKQKRERKLKIILEALEKGSTITNACKTARISRTALWKWQKDKSINDRILSVIDTRAEVVEDALFKRAVGYQYVETRVEDTTKSKGVITTTKEIAPDVAACIFFLSNRRPKRWRNRQEVEHKGQVMTVAQIVQIVNGNNGNNNDKQAGIQTGKRFDEEVG